MCHGLEHFWCHLPVKHIDLRSEVVGGIVVKRGFVIMRKVRLLDQLNLPPRHANFVVEYVKDFATRRASEASGFSADHGYKLIQQPEIIAAVEYIIDKRLENNMIDSDWLLYEMVDNHMIARQQGNITASNAALRMVGGHKRVDAFAADKIKVSTDADVVDRLIGARRRLIEHDEPEEDVSFL